MSNTSKHNNSSWTTGRKLTMTPEKRNSVRTRNQPPRQSKVCGFLSVDLAEQKIVKVMSKVVRFSNIQTICKNPRYGIYCMALSVRIHAAHRTPFSIFDFNPPFNPMYHPLQCGVAQCEGIPILLLTLDQSENDASSSSPFPVATRLPLGVFLFFVFFRID